jgi:molybdopterin-containing oxidoreductase family iron-sulfur binding subunit
LLDVSSLINLSIPDDKNSDSNGRQTVTRSARTSSVDLAGIRQRLESGKGPLFWKSLEEIADTDEFRKFVDDEFPDRTPDWNEPAQRRTFLKVMGASLALAGVTACTKQPPENIVPYVRQPEELVPGKPLFYATARPVSGDAVGLLAESHEGRPTKLEGNPAHPSSKGAIDMHTQAETLNLYDPDRSQSVYRNGNISSWINFVAVLLGARDDHAARGGAGLRLLTPPVNSPTLASQMQDFLKAMPQSKWHQWEPAMRIPGYNPQYHFDKADVIVSLDSDFLAHGPGWLAQTRAFAAKRRVVAPQTPEQQKRALQEGPNEIRPEGQANFNYARAAVAAKDTTNRLYQVEGTPSVTSNMADHRIRIRTSEVPLFAAQLAAALGASAAGVSLSGSLPERATRVLPAIAKDLQAHRGTSLVIAGVFQPPAVHALAHAMNTALGNVGNTVTYAAPVDATPTDNLASLQQLVSDINAGQVDTLIMVDVNPVYDAPADMDFETVLKKVKLRAHLGEFHSETSVLCHWHIPMAHFLESWSDVRAQDGTTTIMQPLIMPMYGGISPHQLFSVLTMGADQTPHDIVKNYWAAQTTSGNFEVFWPRALHDGIVAGTAPAAATAPAFSTGAVPGPPAQGQLELVFRPDPAVGYGRYSNNGWMQELPKPQNKMTWDNAVWISPATSQRLGIHTEDMVEIDHKGRKLTAPVWVLPGHADDSITVHFGYGRAHVGRVADGIGFNAYALRTSDAPWCATEGVSMRKVSGSYTFAHTQDTQTMEERTPFRIINYPEHKDHSKLEAEEIPPELTLFPEWSYSGYKWGMAVDLNACVGCHACITACQAENNVPVVGKDQVSRHRVMHWLRVDRYYKGNLDDPELYFQPLFCMQCETAPCELVCPVGATVHSGDGLNQMVYNRCVGTRYCSNNCPYKVRRFNFYLYSDWYTPSLYGLRNPDVTVRSRGVMEKCTYCIQRIAAAKIESEKEDRRIIDGEIKMACEQACPADALIFGDINDPNSRVAKFKAQPRNYSLLEELNTRPRTTYLARVKNPNPDIEKG